MDDQLHSGRRAFARWAFRHWPTPVGLRFFINALPNPPPGLVTRAISGFPLQFTFYPQTYMGKFLYYRGIYEEIIVREFRKLIRPGMIFIDIGANAGYYTVIAGHLVGSRGQVIAFEPQPELAKLIRSNAVLNQLTNVRIEAVALGSREGEDVLYQVSERNNGQATMRLNDDDHVVGQPIPVHVDTLDKTLNDRRIEAVHGMKIDVEGAELSVLEGFRDHLRSLSRPRFIYVECIDSHLARFGNHSEEIFSLLRGYQYRLLSLSYGRWHPMGTRGESRHSAHILALQ